MTYTTGITPKNDPANKPVGTAKSVAILGFLLFAGVALGWFVFSNDSSQTNVIVTQAPSAEAPLRN